MVSAIVADGVSRFFGAKKAVDRMNFSVEEGEVFGVLGPNGAGKTTLIRLLNGVLTLSEGRAEVLGLDVGMDGEAIRRETGVLTETPSLYERLTAQENLAFYAAMYGIPDAEIPSKIAKSLALFRLEDRGNEPVGGYSKGMKQRLALARALLHSPRVLFLDEPTAGLDPEAAHRVTELIRELAGSGGRTVFLCTHNLHEAQSLCDRVALINGGRLLALGSVADLSARLREGVPIEIDLLAPPPREVRDALADLAGVADLAFHGSRISLSVREQAIVPAVVAAVVRHGGLVIGVRQKEPTLEEIYFRIQSAGRERA